MKTIFSNLVNPFTFKSNREELLFLDDILELLAKSPMKVVSFDDILQHVCMEDTEVQGLVFKYFKSPVPTEGDAPNAFLQSAIMYLRSMDLLAYDVKSWDSQITFKGLLLVRNKGLVQQRNNERFKNWLQNGFWLAAMITLIINIFVMVCSFY